MKMTHYVNGKEIVKNANISNLENEKEKKYKFFLDNIQNYIYITDRLNFVRQGDGYKFELEISKTPSCYILLDDGKKFDIEVIKADYKETKNKIEFRYQISTDEENHHQVILEIEE